MPTTILTNNHARPVLYWWDLTDAERAEFDYLDSEVRQDSATFFRYRGNTYDLGEFVSIVPRERAYGFLHGVDSDSPLLAWDGIQTDSYFSAIVVRHIAPDFDFVVVGRAFS